MPFKERKVENVCRVNPHKPLTLLTSIHRGETGLANAGVSLPKMDAPKVGKSVLCSFEVFYHNFR